MQVRNDTSFREGRERGKLNLNHSYKEEFSLKYTPSVIYLSLYTFFIRVNSLNLKSSAPGD